MADSVTMNPKPALPDVDLSLDEAAELLSVSRDFVKRLLDDGTLRRRGTRESVSLGDVLAYRKHDDAARAAILDQLTAEAQKLGLGY